MSVIASMIEEDLLDRLLRGAHIGLGERVSRGAWPHAPLKLGELAKLVAVLIDRETVFPRPWVPAQPGQPVDEGGVVTREGPHRYVYRAQRSHPLDPTVLVDSVETVFRSADGAARHYLKFDLGLPGELDGWEVVP